MFYANVCQTTGKNQSFPHRILFTFKSESDLITTPSANMHKTYSLSYPSWICVLICVMALFKGVCQSQS